MDMIFRKVLLAFMLMGSIITSSAQVQSASSDTVAHDLNGLKFKTTTKFKRREATKLPSNSMIFVNQKNEGESVFVIIPKAKQTLIASLEELRSPLAISLLPTEATEYQWRPIEKPYYLPAGKFDTGGGQIMGFNGQTSLLLEYHQIQYQNQIVVVGYLYVFARGDRAASAFRSSLGGGNGSAGDECVVIVRSITREEAPTRSPGMPPPLAPGAPPPPAPAPKKP
jgi:hypothetical protein